MSDTIRRNKRSPASVFSSEPAATTATTIKPRAPVLLSLTADEAKYDQIASTVTGALESRPARRVVLTVTNPGFMTFDNRYGSVSATFFPELADAKMWNELNDAIKLQSNLSMTTIYQSFVKGDDDATTHLKMGTEIGDDFVVRDGLTTLDGDRLSMVDVPLEKSKPYQVERMVVEIFWYSIKRENKVGVACTLLHAKLKTPEDDSIRERIRNVYAELDAERMRYIGDAVRKFMKEDDN